MSKYFANCPRCNLGLNSITRARSYAWVLLALSMLSAVVLAQTSPYEDRLVSNLRLIDSWRSCLMYYPSQQDTPPVGSLSSLQQAVAEVHLALNDAHVSEHEPRLADEFDRMVIAGFPDHYQTLGMHLNEAATLIDAGRKADPVAYDFAVDRLADLVSRQCFALPLLLYEGPTPYADLYQHSRSLFEQATGEAEPPPDLRSLEWPSVSLQDLGQTQVLSITEKRRIEEQAREAKQVQLAQSIASENAVRQANIKREVEDAQRAANTDLQRELAQAQALIDGTAKEHQKSGGGWSWLWIVAGISAVGYFARHKINAVLHKNPAVDQQWQKAKGKLAATLGHPSNRRAEENNV